MDVAIVAERKTCEADGASGPSICLSGRTDRITSSEIETQVLHFRVVRDVAAPLQRGDIEILRQQSRIKW
jgi:hypothetical protein